MNKSLLKNLNIQTNPCTDRGGFIIDLTDYAGANPAFNRFDLTETDSADCQLVVTLSLANDVESLSSTYKALLHLWSQVAYRYFQATSCEWKRDCMQLDFATSLNENSGTITGLIQIAGERYQILARRFEAKFGEPLPE